MTITHFPERMGPSGIIETTNAMILGYDHEDEAELNERLSYCKDAIFSPFTLIKAFLCVEKSRRWKEVNRKIAEFQSILQNYGRIPIDYERSVASDAEGRVPRRASAGTRSRKDANSADPKNLIGLYIEVCTLKNSLAAWASQLKFFSENIEDDEFGSASLSDISPREYLRCLMEEYSLKINKCDLVLQGASLAFQMETAHLSRVDTQIALRDGKQMKAIAVLTMVFLPATFVATLLAVPQFKGIEEIQSVPIWSWYLIIFLPLTAVVLGSYFVWINCFRKASADHSLKMV
ncbi:hypothetical protein CcaCcLH18_01190 [Colletotrichum camelliae]|nr:hypothetical protein CcaCcLH18_01190 [Colletotrichum camelliae]